MFRQSKLCANKHIISRVFIPLQRSALVPAAFFVPKVLPDVVDVFHSGLCADDVFVFDRIFVFKV